MLSALQSAEQSSAATDLKSVIYAALVQSLKAAGIDPKTFQPTSGDGQSGSTSDVRDQVLTALSGIGESSGLLSPLSTASADSGSGSDDLASLLTNSQGSGSSAAGVFSPYLVSQNNNPDLLGFLFDSGQ